MNDHNQVTFCVTFIVILRRLLSVLSRFCTILVFFSCLYKNHCTFLFHFDGDSEESLIEYKEERGEVTDNTRFLLRHNYEIKDRYQEHKKRYSDSKDLRTKVRLKIRVRKLNTG